jgi:hypothetical protein
MLRWMSREWCRCILEAHIVATACSVSQPKHWQQLNMVTTRSGIGAAHLGCQVMNTTPMQTRGIRAELVLRIRSQSGRFGSLV